MSGYLCTFLDSCNLIPSISYHISSKPFPIVTPIHHLPYNSPSTRIIRTSRSRRRKTNGWDPLQISALSQNFHLIQTSEHHDGSLIFRFGDLSEIPKTDGKVEDLTSEGEDGSQAVKVVEGDQEKEVIVETIDSRERGESEVRSSNFVSESVSDVDIGTIVIERVGGVEKDLSDSLVESSGSDSVVKEFDGEGAKGSNVAQVLDGDYEKQVTTTTVIAGRGGNYKVTTTTVIEGRGGYYSVTDVSETQAELSVLDNMVEDLESEGEERSNDVNADEDHEKQEPDKTVKIKEMTISDTSSSSDVSDSTNEVDNQINVVRWKKDASDSQEESSEVPIEISEDEKVALPLSVSVSETEINDFVSSDLGLENADDKEISSDEENENASSNPVELEVAVESFTTGRIKNSEKVIASAVKFEAPSFKIESSIEDPNIGVMQLSYQKIEGGSKIQEADSSSEAEGEISVAERVKDVVGDPGDSHLEMSEIPLVLSEEIDLSASDSKIHANDQFDTVGSMGDSVANEDETSIYIADSSLSIENSGAILETSAYVNESPSFELDDLDISDPVNEEMKLSVEAADQNLVSDSGKIPIEEVTPLALGLEAGSVHDDVVGHEALEEFAEAGDVESRILSEPSSECPRIGVMQGSDQKIEAGSQIQAAYSSSEASGDISVDQAVNDVVGDLSDTPSEMLSDLTEEARVQLAKTIEDEINKEEAEPLAQGLEAEPVLDDVVGRDALEEFAEVDDIESPMLLNQDSLVGGERTEVEEQSNELSELPILIQSELAETNVEREKISSTAFLLSSGVAALTHPSKALTGGEDAYFLSCSNWLGVADGISQWSLEGIDRGVYAHELMKNCEIIVSNNGSALMANPTEVLSRSVKETQSSGSSTILVAYFDGQALHVANIGDTGFMIIRHGVVYKKSAPMFHEFNFPVHIQRGDNPLKFSEEYIVDLDEGDAIVTATDGLFDNLYEQEIASIVSKSLQAAMKPEEIAQELATRAQEVGKSAKARSPFGDAAKAAGYTGFTGGKLDDVAVIVSLVENKSNFHKL